MNQQPILSDAEWGLVVELLDREASELPSEIRHTRLSQYRDELRRREQLVRDLLARLRTAAPA